MEFNARYAVTGLFAIAVIAAIFGFAWWLNNTAGFGEQTRYQIRFTVPVSGLAAGSSVLFNGIKVGEVTAIRFDPEQPGSLVTEVSIASQTPVRSDTLVGVDYQGLTGAANVLLTGGVAGAPLLDTGVSGMPELLADPTASRSWMQLAGRALGRLDEMLNRNSGRFDSILEGLERMTGGGKDKPPAATQDLPVPNDFPPAKTERTWQLAIAEPSVLLAMNTDRVQQQAADGSLQAFGETRWPDNLPNLFQAKIIQAFENAGYANAVLRPADAADPDIRIVIDIRTFHVLAGEKPVAHLDFVAKLVDRAGVVRQTRQFKFETAAASGDEAAAVGALGQAFTSALRELVTWTVASI